MSEAALFRAVPVASCAAGGVDVLLTLNAGSSSIKFALFDVQGPLLRLSGQIDGLGTQVRFLVCDADGDILARQQWQDGATQPTGHRDALAWIIGWLDKHQPGLNVVAVGHRVVHGGSSFGGPVLIDGPTLDALHALVPLAPLHQPHNLAGIAAARARFGDVPQVACFDTAFHRGLAFNEEAFALPRHFHAEGVRRYGFHGLSYEYIAGQLRALDPGEAMGRVVVAHLGNGASLCALRQGRSVAATMGFSALDGLPMGTRSGRVDPGVLLYLVQQRGMGADELSHLLYHQSGLKALSGGLSHDMRTLEEAGTPEAEQAIGYFVAAVLREIGMLAATLQGLDALVFTGGIGENSQRVRREVMLGLDWLGVVVQGGRDAGRTDMIRTAPGRPQPARAAAAGQATPVSAEGSPVLCLRIATDEESMIARHTARMAGVCAM